MSGTPKCVPVPALDLRAQYKTIRDEVEPIVLGLFESQMFVMGPEVQKLERELAAFCWAGLGIGCAFGTDALLLPLLAWGVGPGDEVITHAILVLRDRGLDLAHRKPSRSSSTSSPNRSTSTRPESKLPSRHEPG